MRCVTAMAHSASVSARQDAAISPRIRSAAGCDEHLHSVTTVRARIVVADRADEGRDPADGRVDTAAMRAARSRGTSLIRAIRTACSVISDHRP